ncbi:hypothetical protein L4X63_04675 [Geomonas sp. Red32]|uniref:hypothetical protein n=1 Tax=Geomonas sp. Red32 TaxID=2912856 RepID=UPI00202CD3EE|nr:hypothetical protein [Geomonas sp. Red32]MCM0080881.1 hypothetical protein [Geomonas sp. Red32]
MKQRIWMGIMAAVLAATSLPLVSTDAWAVANYSRRYGIDCSVCHTVWGALTGAGVQFRLSGYRAIGGHDLKPVSPDMEISNGLISIPTTLPLSIVTGVGYEYRAEKRYPETGGSNTRVGSSIALEDASIFLTSPVGKHLSAFIEFPMYETKAWEFTPTGRAAANDPATGNIQFASASPAFEVAKFFWNNLLPEGTVPRDSVSLLAGITHPPLAYSPGKVRLSINQYLIYERRPLDLISPKKTDTFLTSDQDDGLFRLSEPQVQAEIMGMVVPGHEVTDVSKKETFWFEYHAGVMNASNTHADNNVSKAVYGRYVMRWYGQSLGVFGFYTGNIYDDSIINAGQAAGIMSGKLAKNSDSRIGPDMTLSLAPFGIPVWLENQYMYNREGDPTGFGKEFVWQGGFHQLNYQPTKKSVAYARYDWLRGNTYDDGHNGATRPTEWDVVAGTQYLVTPNMKLAGEYRHHEFSDRISTAGLKDDGFSAKFMVGF